MLTHSIIIIGLHRRNNVLESMQFKLHVDITTREATALPIDFSFLGKLPILDPLKQNYATIIRQTI